MAHPYNHHKSNIPPQPTILHPCESNSGGCWSFTHTKAIGEGVLLETPPVNYVDILCSEIAYSIFRVKIIHL